ncbi:MAG TPA: hypothetical protein VKN64_07120 [Halanaerobiales bacterium]|nr:hypothetical protein [Halanaerobiales bacterium]
MAWLVILMAINVFYNNTRLNYNDKVIASLNKRKEKQLIAKREFTEKHKDNIEKLNKKHKKALDEFNQKKSIDKIAKNLKMGIRETRLIAKLYSYRGGEML